jgi:hypothetical protein
MTKKPWIIAGALALFGIAAFAACEPSFTTDAAVKGAEDAHCAGKSQAIDEASCKVMANTGGGAPDEGYPPTMYNAEGDDDDCKYHVSWTASDVAENQDVTFKVVITTLADGKPATGADPEPEVYLDETHYAPATQLSSTEDEPGTYTVGPVRFDAPGKWTVRFHIHEECTDIAEDSPHGHAAFYVQVP